MNQTTKRLLGAASLPWIVLLVKAKTIGDDPTKHYYYERWGKKGSHCKQRITVGCKASAVPASLDDQTATYWAIRGHNSITLPLFRAATRRRQAEPVLITNCVWKSVGIVRAMSQRAFDSWAGDRSAVNRARRSLADLHSRETTCFPCQPPMLYSRLCWPAQRNRLRHCTGTTYGTMATNESQYKRTSTLRSPGASWIIFQSDPVSDPVANSEKLSIRNAVKKTAVTIMEAVITINTDTPHPRNIPWSWTGMIPRIHFIHLRAKITLTIVD